MAAWRAFAFARFRWRIMASTDIVGYTYDTEILCPSCTVEAVMMMQPYDTVEKCLDSAALVMKINRQDERSFDSNEFPKVIVDSQVEDSDERCAHCGEALIQ